MIALLKENFLKNIKTSKWNTCYSLWKMKLRSQKTHWNQEKNFYVYFEKSIKNEKPETENTTNKKP